MIATVFWKPSTPRRRARQTSAMPPMATRSIRVYSPKVFPSAVSQRSAMRRSAMRAIRQAAALGAAVGGQVRRFPTASAASSGSIGTTGSRWVWKDCPGRAARAGADPAVTGGTARGPATTGGGAKTGAAASRGGLAGGIGRRARGRLAGRWRHRRGRLRPGDGRWLGRRRPTGGAPAHRAVRAAARGPLAVSAPPPGGRRTSWVALTGRTDPATTASCRAGRRSHWRWAVSTSGRPRAVRGAGCGCGSGRAAAGRRRLGDGPFGAGLSGALALTVHRDHPRERLFQPPLEVLGLGSPRPSPGPASGLFPLCLGLDLGQHVAENVGRGQLLAAAGLGGWRAGRWGSGHSGRLGADPAALAGRAPAPGGELVR